VRWKEAPESGTQDMVVAGDVEDVNIALGKPGTNCVDAATLEEVVAEDAMLKEEAEYRGCCVVGS